VNGPTHLPVRPAWVCDDDGQDWPCPGYQDRLLRRHDRNEVAMSTAMAEWMRDARHDLVLDAIELHTRFVGWIPRRLEDSGSHDPGE
jgi:hypothetical protein